MGEGWVTFFGGGGCYLKLQRNMFVFYKGMIFEPFRLGKGFDYFGLKEVVEFCFRSAAKG